MIPATVRIKGSIRSNDHQDVINRRISEFVTDSIHFCFDNRKRITSKSIVLIIFVL